MSSEDEPNPTWETVSLPEQAEQYYVMSKKIFHKLNMHASNEVFSEVIKSFCKDVKIYI